MPRHATGDTPNAPPRSTLYSGPKNTSEYSLYGHATNPGYGRKSELVHSHTSPMSCRAPLGAAPAGYEPAGAGARCRCPRLARLGDGVSSPHGYRRDRPLTGSYRAAFSHSASEGSRRPAHRAYASASYQHTCNTGSFGIIGLAIPKETRTHSPSQRQDSGAFSPARCRCAQPSAVHQRGSS